MRIRCEVTVGVQLRKLSDQNAESEARADPFDEDAFCEFFRTNYRDLIKYVMYLGATAHEAENAVSTAILYLVQHWNRIDSHMAYAQRAARNAFLKVRTRAREIVFADLSEAATCLDSSSQLHIEARETVDWLLSELDRLTDRQRDAIALSIDGLTPKEIAEILGEKPEVVRQTLRRARLKLRRTWEGGRPERRQVRKEAP